MENDEVYCQHKISLASLLQVGVFTEGLASGFVIEVGTQIATSQL